LSKKGKATAREDGLRMHLDALGGKMVCCFEDLLVVEHSQQPPAENNNTTP